MHRGIALGVKHYLRDPCSIAQVDKHDHAVVPPLLDPAVQDDRLPDSSFCKLPTPMSSDLHTTFAFLACIFMTVRREIAEPRRETDARSREDPMRTRAVR